MLEKILNLFVFRMVHFDNLEYILEAGMCCKNHMKSNPDYITIGHPQLIIDRNEYSVKIIPPGGKLGEYVPFYFAGHSPMLLKIKTGYGVKQIPQENIVFVACRIRDILKNCDEWCFTDGNAKKSITKFFNNLTDFDKLDFEAINAQYWYSTMEDMDKERKKQAEFLVKNMVPSTCISLLIVKNQQRKEDAEKIKSNSNLDIKIKIDSNNKLYYP